MTDHLYREIEALRGKNEHLSKALADMIAMYEAKQRNGVRLGKARAALNLSGSLPDSPATVTGDANG